MTHYDLQRLTPTTRLWCVRMEAEEGRARLKLHVFVATVLTATDGNGTNVIRDAHRNIVQPQCAFLTQEQLVEEMRYRLQSALADLTEECHTLAEIVNR